MIELRDVEYVYNDSGKSDESALENVNLTIHDGEFVGIAGHTGSGKSTLIQLMNGLLKPTSGKVIVDGEDINEKDYDRRQLKFKVGIVFQYSEYQLFENDVLSDVMYGPKNKGLSEEEAKKLAVKALETMNFPEDKYEKSPFELSGGEKKKAAIAGILAMEPEVLVLDEPTAGLDPVGRRNLYDILKEMNRSSHIKVVVVSHSMEDMAEYAHRLVVMNNGKIVMDDETSAVFSKREEIQDIGLDIPVVAKLMQELHKRGMDVDTSIIKKEDAIKCLERLL